MTDWLFLFKTDPLLYLFAAPEAAVRWCLIPQLFPKTNSL